ncbi:MAG TPA: mechanosensitive ion channel domain-containing protein [Hyphomicrobiaceae bacterium]|nr:mechanosensitive ion channel domain-containing protein [Hyphomicrobiaceae bacterium]
MDEILTEENFDKAKELFESWIASDVFVWSNLTQLLTVALLFFAARPIAAWLKTKLDALFARETRRRVSSIVLKNAAKLTALTLPAVWLFLLWIAVVAFDYAKHPTEVLRIATSLLAVWLAIRLTSNLVRDPGWAKAITVIAWLLAALSILGLLDDATAVLDGVAITIAGVRISALLVLNAILSLAILLWVAILASRILERRITQSVQITPTFQVLLIKLLKVVLVGIAIAVALSTVGIDLTAFAVFGGAIGLGIGFGLQKIVSNLISGVIILLDKSIKPGDVIKVGDTFGWINSLGARYASVVTRDGTEYLIPNEDLITQQVVNWSYSHDAVRLKIPIGISYKSDPRKAIDLCFEAAREEKRILETPAPNVLVKGFGDSSVDIEMRIWIRDPKNGVSNIKSAVLLRVWDKFHENGIEIPYPQRDVHLIPPIDVDLEPEGQGA